MATLGSGQGFSNTVGLWNHLKTVQELLDVCVPPLEISHPTDVAWASAFSKLPGGHLGQQFENQFSPWGHCILGGF